MNAPDQPRLDRRVLILPPTQKDGVTTKDVLWRAGVDSETCSTAADLAAQMQRGVAAVLLPEEAIPDASPILAPVLAQQPPWSDVPLLVLTRPGADSADVSYAVSALGNVMLLERPVRVATLVSSVRTALRARERQYQIRRHLAELNDADRRKDEFLATLGHELRNPLSPLVTSLEVLKLTMPADPVVTRSVAVMQRQASHLVRLVDDLLEVSRITRGLIDVQREPVELSEIVAAAIETSRPIIEGSQHVFTLDMTDEPLMVMGDAVRLTQVIANLLNNAAKYTDPGGHVALTVRHTKDEALIIVCDDGIGIEPEHLASVFDMFTQVYRSDRRTQGGLGIGLTLVRSLIALHGGSVDASSAGRGKGSTFEIRLPLIQGAPAHDHTAAVHKMFPGRRVLAVDDNQDATDALQTLLEALGVTVATAASGLQALEAMDAFQPDTVLLDIGMPGMDGYEVARRLRAKPSGSRLQLIALTGWGQQEDVRRCLQAGFDHHLVKPLDIDKLRSLMATGSRVVG
jgi:signal transduction histidine kinase/CheY-like chemotaxis protein